MQNSKLKVQNYSSMFKIFFVFSLVIITLYFAFLTFNLRFAHAQSVSFPIPELGNCTNVATCKVYCDQPENRNACIAFAKAKGFSKVKGKVNEKQVALLEAAKTELGCQTVPTCQALCDQPENVAKCEAFAKRHGMASTPPPSEISDEELLKAAKEKLGCESYDSCQRLCDEERNYTKCAALMQSQVTEEDRAMFEKYKPLIKEYLGCDSIVTCMAFCINPLNTKKCQGLAERIEVEQGGTDSSDNSEPPEVWCPKVSSECSWDGTNCVCQGPQTCAQSNDIPGCTWDGSQCNCPGIAEDPPQVWCPKAGPGCAWDGTHCICPGTSEAPIQSGAQEPGDVWCPKIGPYCVWDGSSCTCWDECVKSGGTWTGSKCELPQESREVWCSKLGQYCVWDGSSCTCWDECVKSGGNWTGQTCEYQGGTNQPQIESNIESPEVSCVRNPDCKWTGESCSCTPVQATPTVEQSPQPQVQGITTNQGLLRQILDFVLELL